MSIFDFLGDLISPITNLVGKIITKDEDKAVIQNQLVALQNGIKEKMLDYENRLLDAQTQIITAEVKSESWITKSWRPIAMLTFLGIIVYQGIFVSVFSLPAVHFETIPEKMWSLLEIGIGGYVGGRTIEKIAPTIADAFKGGK